jgi:hypothetical protein
VNNAVYPSLRNQSACAAGAGRILATLILGLASVAAGAQNSPSNDASLRSSSVSVQAASLQNGADRLNGPNSRVNLSSDPASVSASSGGQRASSAPPPTTGTAATAYSQSGISYGSTNGNPLGYAVIIPHGGVDHDESTWAGPVSTDERERGPRRLSMEERLRLRSDIRDASRNMYEHPRGPR